MHLTDITKVPFEFLDRFYGEHTVFDDELDQVYADWCERNGLQRTPEYSGSFHEWLSSFMDQLTDDSWMPRAVVEDAMDHMNLLIDECAKHWSAGAPCRPLGHGIVAEYAGIIIHEDPEHGDESPLLVQFGMFEGSPCFQTDCYDPADIWITLNLNFPAAKEN